MRAAPIARLLRCRSLPASHTYARSDSTIPTSRLPSSMAAARMYAAFVVSVFSTTFMARTFFDAANSFVSKTKQADARTIRAMFSMKITLQQGYLRLVGVDIPAWAINFLNDNAHNLHGYIVSLAEAVRLASIIGSVCLLFLSPSLLLLPREPIDNRSACSTLRGQTCRVMLPSV